MCAEVGDQRTTSGVHFYLPCSLKAGLSFPSKDTCWHENFEAFSRLQPCSHHRHARILDRSGELSSPGPHPCVASTPRATSPVVQLLIFTLFEDH